MLCIEPFESVYIVQVLLLSFARMLRPWLIALSSANRIEDLLFSATLPLLNNLFVLLLVVRIAIPAPTPVSFRSVCIYIYVSVVFVIEEF